ncbi:MAG: sialidase family protein [Candidatus Zixiibacteriota bacterium]
MIRFARLFALATALLLVASSTHAVPIPPNVPVSGHQSGLQNEEQAWICPIDTNVVITNHRDFRLGYRQIGLGRSTDGGATWTDSLIRTSYQIFNRQSDPIMTVNSSGHFFISHLDYDASGNDGLSYIAFLRSTDKGATWTGPYVVESDLGPYFEDKQFVTCDRTGGPYDGNLYISWTRFTDLKPNRIMFARSTFDALFFDDTIMVGPPLNTTCTGIVSAGQFSQPLAGKDGAVYVFWQGYHVDSSGGGCDWYNAIRYNKSTDGGVTWEGDRMLRPVDGWSYVDGNVDVYSQPTTDADITAGPHAGNLYLQYRDVDPNSPFFDSDIMFQRSLDTGHTWSAPIRVNDDPVGPDVDQFHNWMVCNDEGILVSIWYDQRTDPSHYLFDVFAAYSFDGGATWSSNHRVSSISINPNLLAKAQALAQEAVMSAGRSGNPGLVARPLGPMTPLTPMAGKIAEYIAVSAVGDKVVAVWTDTRDGDQDVWSARWYLPLTDPRLIYPLNSELIDPNAPGLLWATAWKESEDLYRLQISSSSGFGTTLRDLFVTGTQFNDAITDLASGTYYWRIKAYRAPGGVPAESTAFSAPGLFQIPPPPCSCPCAGDPQCDGLRSDLQDVVKTVDVAFRGMAPVIDPICPRARTDVDCDGVTSITDVVREVNVAFRGANPATEFCDPCAP